MKKYCPEWVRPRSALGMREMKVMTVDGCMDIRELTDLGLLLLYLLFFGVLVIVVVVVYYCSR